MACKRSGVRISLTPFVIKKSCYTIKYMSGHNKWSQIRRQKGVNDAIRSKVYTKLSRQIILAVKKGGGDISNNVLLRIATEKSKEVGMTSLAIEKAISKGLGLDKESDLLDSMTYEANGVNRSVALLIDVVSDNRNRSSSEIRYLVEKNGGRFLQEGSVSWQFDTLGIIVVSGFENENRSVTKNNDSNFVVQETNLDDLGFQVMDINGVIDIELDETEHVIYIFTENTKLYAVRGEIIKRGLSLESSEIIKRPKVYFTPDIELTKQEGMFEKDIKLKYLLEDYEDVINVWTNLLV